MKEIFLEYGSLIVAVIVIGLLIGFITLEDTGFAAQINNGITQSISSLFELTSTVLP